MADSSSSKPFIDTMAEEGVDNTVSPPTTVAVNTEEDSIEDTKIESTLNNTKNDVVVSDTDILLPTPDLNDTDPLLDVEPIINITSAPTVSPSASSTEDTNTSSPSVHQTTLQPTILTTTGKCAVVLFYHCLCKPHILTYVIINHLFSSSQIAVTRIFQCLH